MQILKISLNPELYSALEMIARDNHVPVETTAVQILGDSVRKKRHETMRILQPDHADRQNSSETDTLYEIIKRQDAEITWLRDHITRISPSIPVGSSMYPESPALHQVKEGAVNQITGSQPGKEQDLSSSEMVATPAVTVDDVQYSPGAGEANGIEDLITRDAGAEGSRYQGKERASDRMLRDSIGGVREEKKYSLKEAAAIAGETESVILEFIMDGFLPAIKDEDSYQIQGNDLRRYMLSK
jgi:hypothetical protein